MDTHEIADFPLVMLSEGIHLDKNVFKKLTGPFIAKSKGSVAFSPVYKEIKEFTNHLKDIFTNAIIFPVEVATNTWLQDVFDKITGCTTQSCVMNPISNQKFLDEFGKPPLYVQYAILAAHAIANAISLIHAQYCPNTTGICETFTSKYRPSDILKQLRGANLKFGLDFSWQLTDFANGVQNLRIDPSGEITPELGQPFYQVFNFRQSEVSQNSSQVELVLVGNYINSSLSLDLNRFRDYNSQGQETTWPSMRKGQCKEGRRCSECLPLNVIQERPFFQEGDAYVIGTIPVFDSSGTTDCGNIRLYNGYQLNEALIFAIKKINTNDTVFPKLTIGLVVLNSCDNPVQIQRKILDMVKNGLLLSNGTRISLLGKIIGFVGDVTSTTSISVAEILTRLQQVQISFSSTAALLSDRIQYPYFARVVTSDIEQANAIISIVKKLKSNYIQLIHSEGNYGEGMRDNLKEIGEKENVCIKNIISVGVSYNVASFRDNLRKYPEAKLVVIVVQSSTVYEFLTNLANNINKREFVFIGSQAWGKNPFVISNDTRQHFLGSYTLSLDIYPNPVLKSYLEGVNVSPDNVNSWKHLYLEIYGDCYYEFSFDKSKTKVCSQPMKLVPDSWTTMAYVAVKSLLIGANAYFSKVCGNSSKSLCPAFTENPKGLYTEILKVKTEIDGSGDQLKVFNNNGDGTVGYRIYNIQINPDNPQELLYSEVGSYSQGQFTLKQPVIEYDFSSVCPNQQECDACFNVSTTVPVGTSKLQVNVGTVTVLVFFAAAVVVNVILGIYIWWTKKGKEDTTYITPTQNTSVDGEDSGCEIKAAVGSKVFSDVIPCCSGPTSEAL